MKKYIIPICLGVLLSSCSWLDKEDDKSVIEGHFYKNCNLEPIANKTFTLEQDHSVFTKYAVDQMGSITTDANGYFKFEYESNSMNGYINFKDGNYTVTGVLYKPEFDY